MMSPDNFALRLQCGTCGGATFQESTDADKHWYCIACGSGEMRLVQVRPDEEVSYSTYCAQGCRTHLCAPGHCWMRSALHPEADGSDD